MEKIFALVVVLGFMAAATAQYSPDPSMNAWYHLDESASPVMDFSGFGRHGTVQGATFLASGKFAGARTFAGTSVSRIDLPDATYGLSGQGGASIAAWVRRASGQANAVGTVLFIDRAGATATRLQLTVNSNGTVSIKGRSNAEASLLAVTTTATIPVGTWAHIVGVVKLAADSGFVYLDGALSRGAPMAFSQGTFTTTTTSNATMGAIAGSSSYSFKGDIDEIALWNRALSPSEVGALYQPPPPLWTLSWLLPPTPAEDTTVSADSAVVKLSSSLEPSSATLTVIKGEAKKQYRISVAQATFDKWLLRYPVTYVFELESASTVVERRDTSAAAWVALPVKDSSALWNGIEAVRLAADGKTLLVSVAFATRPTLFLRFASQGKITYQGATHFYDNRKGAYTLSLDNWGWRATASPGVSCAQQTSNCDKYKAAYMVTRGFGLYASVGINTNAQPMGAAWPLIQSEIDFGYLEPATHSGTHPCSHSAYSSPLGYNAEILGSRDSILARLSNIPYGQRVFEFILPCGFENSTLSQTSAGEFLLLRDWISGDSPGSTGYAPWDATYGFYKGFTHVKAYDAVLEARTPKGRYYAADVANLNQAVDNVLSSGGLAAPEMWHPDRYENSVVYDPSPPVEGVAGSSLIQHLAHISGRLNVWYAANGWMHLYRHVALNASVQMHVEGSPPEEMPMAVSGLEATRTLAPLSRDSSYHFRAKVRCLGDSLSLPAEPAFRRFYVAP